MECVGLYLSEMRRVWRPKTLQSHGNSLSHFCAWIEATSRRRHFGLETLSRALVGRFWDYSRDERGLMVSSANVRVRHVEQFWSWCHDHEELGDVTPRPRRMRLPSVDVVEVLAPTWAEMDRVIDAFTVVHYQRLCMVLRCTGLRVGQAMRLRWDDVDVGAATLRVRSELGKTRAERRSRTVPIAPVLLEEIAGWGRREGWLVDWPVRTGRRVVVSPVIQRAWLRTGISEEVWRKRSAHAFRKGFVSGLIGAGAAREAVEYLVGHTMGLRGVYTDPSALPLRETVALVPGCVRSVATDGGALRVTSERR